MRPLVRFSSSSGFPPYSSSLRLATPATLLGLPCRSAHSFRRSLLAPEIPISRFRAAFRVSHPLRGLLLHRPCRFISPRKRASASPSKGFPSRKGGRIRHSPLTALQLRVVPTHLESRYRRTGLAPSVRSAPRLLRGFASPGSPCRRGWMLSNSAGRALPGFSPLQGFSAVTMRQLIIATPPVRFIRCSSYDLQRTALRSIARPGSFGPLARSKSLLRFLAVSLSRLSSRAVLAHFFAAPSGLRRRRLGVRFELCAAYRSSRD